MRRFLHPTTRSGRRLLWGGGIAVGLLLAVAICEITGWRFLRVPVQNAIADATRAQVSLDGRFRLHLLLRPSLSIEHVRIGAARGFSVPHLLDASNFSVGWNWRDIIAWRQGAALRISSLTANAADAHLVRLSDGRATWQLTPPSSPGEASTLPPQLGYFSLGRGDIHVDDRPTQTKLEVVVRGSEGTAIAQQAGDTSAGYTVAATGRFRALPFKLDAKIGGALPLLQDAVPGAADPRVTVQIKAESGNSQLSFDGTASALVKAQRVEGELHFAGPSLAAVGDPLGVTLPRTPPFRIDGRIAHDAGVFQLQADKATIGSSQLSGDFKFDSNAKPPLLSGRLQGPRLLLADLGPSIGKPDGADTKAVPPAASASGATATTPANSTASGRVAMARVLPDRPFDLPSMRAMNADVQVSIDELNFGTTALSSMRPLQTHLVLQAGVLELRDLKAAVTGGQVAGFTRLDGRADPAKWAAQLRFSGLDLAGWVRGLQKDSAASQATAGTAANSPAALRQRRLTANRQPEREATAYATGELTGAIDLTGSGRSAAAILGSIDGSAEISLKDGSLSHLIMEALGLDVAQALGIFVIGDHPLPLRCGRVDMVAKEGVVVLKRALLDNKDSTLRVGGHVDLRNETLEIKAQVRPKDISPLTLRTPLLVDGTLSSPRPHIQAKQLAGRAVAAVVLGAIATPAAVLPFIDLGDSEKGDLCAGVPASAMSTAGPAASSASAASPSLAATQAPVRR